ncbi:hypothetical protein SYNPS1DRAFT_20277 [Syncephalis pseudoplumigaleata]|uniref:ADF-H domain-containing protein n=1 Tax=Syncephalis pseudoplumigaleata TaxID=1712513 RepID=A0A4P9YSD6_9FUNG|nr:hypothetical protein SYNPS1DRAFT_20277 [Syncephalis pseudoplumigaleata]|eukprot:RKP22272.1 hypothetical protein SYNPS1DRAFT_20277 [Syncephalis pseudoplumigaleata]
MHSRRLLLQYEGPKSDSLVVAGTGTGGLAELKTHLKRDQAAYAYVRMIISNDELSKRPKFVLICWCGEGVGVMRKAKMSIHLSDVNAIIKHQAIKRDARTLGELSEDEIKLALRIASGNAAWNDHCTDGC